MKDHKTFFTKIYLFLLKGVETAVVRERERERERDGDGDCYNVLTTQ